MTGVTTWPVIAISGTLSSLASAMAVTRFVAPGTAGGHADTRPAGRARVALGRESAPLFMTRQDRADLIPIACQRLVDRHTGAARVGEHHFHLMVHQRLDEDIGPEHQILLLGLLGCGHRWNSNTDGTLGSGEHDRCKTAKSRGWQSVIQGKPPSCSAPAAPPRGGSWSPRPSGRVAIERRPGPCYRVAMDKFAVFEKFAWIGLFGATGAVARYSVSDWCYRLLGQSFPFGTLAVNLIGCFALGFVAHMTQTTELIPAYLRDGVKIGLLGAFTTFSTFGYETLELVQSGQWRAGLLNVVVSVVCGVFAVWLGLSLARALYGGA